MLGQSERAAWLEQRRTGIGGSDAAAILGLNSWSSPFAVWMDKLGKLPEKADNEQMRLGRDLEDYVAKRWSEVTGKRVRRDTRMLRHPEHRFMLANIDRRVIGENAGLECKTTSILNLKKFKGGEFPAAYYCQCMHYMAVTGAPRWYLAVLVLNEGLHEYAIERDEDEIAALVEAERTFWGYVEAKEPPPVDGHPATTDAIEALCGEPSGSAVDLFGVTGYVRSYQQAKAEIKALEQVAEKCKQKLMLELGENERGTCDGYFIDWKKQCRNTFDASTFFSDHPEYVEDAARYWNATQFRRFAVKENKYEQQ